MLRLENHFSAQKSLFGSTNNFSTRKSLFGSKNYFSTRKSLFGSDNNFSTWKSLFGSKNHFSTRKSFSKICKRNIISPKSSIFRISMCSCQLKSIIFIAPFIFLWLSALSNFIISNLTANGGKFLVSGNFCFNYFFTILVTIF